MALNGKGADLLDLGVVDVEYKRWSFIILVRYSNIILVLILQVSLYFSSHIFYKSFVSLVDFSKEKYFFLKFENMFS